MSWNPIFAIKGNKGILSPALTLAHEISHAVRFHEVGFDVFDNELESPLITDRMQPWINNRYGVSDEEERATEAANIIARKLNHPVRNGYSDDERIIVKDSIYHCFWGNPKCGNEF